MNTSSKARVLRGERTALVGAHAFTAVSDLPRVVVDRPVSTGDIHLDTLRGAAWDDGVSQGVAEGRELGYADGHREGREAGHRSGFAEGMGDGMAAAHADNEVRMGAALAGLESAVSDLLQRDALAMADIEAQVVDLALGLAAAILDREITLTSDPGADAIRRALQVAPDRGDVLVRLHPDDVAKLVDPQALAPGRAIRVAADPSLLPGGCTVDVGAARIDASVESALESARSILEGRLDGEVVA